MRFNLSVTSIVVPRESGAIIISLDLGQPGTHGEIVMTPEQAQQLAHDVAGAAVVAARNIDGPALITPDLLAVTVSETNHGQFRLPGFQGGRHYGLTLDTMHYRAQGKSQ